MRIVIAEETIRSHVHKASDIKQCTVGLVIGQSIDQRDFIVHLARTPLLQAYEHGNDLNEKEVTVSDWDPELVAQHAKQVTRMLPGGLDVLGVFCITQTSTLQTEVLAALHKVLQNVHKTLAKMSYSSASDRKEALLLHICDSSGSYVCKSADHTGAQLSLRPTEFKFKTELGRWLCLECRLATDIHVKLPVGFENQSLIKQIKSGLQPLCDQIACAHALVDGEFRAPDQPLLVSLSKEGKRGKHHPQGSKQVFKVELFVEKTCVVEDHDDDELNTVECGVKMNIRGTIQGRAYVHNKALVEDGMKMIKMDLGRSLMSRCEIHCEDLLVIDEEQQDRVIVHEPPFRVFAPLADIGLTVSDYLFPGEKPEDSLDAFEELLALKYSPEDIAAHYESVPKADDLTPTIDSKDDRESSVSEILQPIETRDFMGLSVAVAVAAGSVSYLLLKQG